MTDYNYIKVNDLVVFKIPTEYSRGETTKGIVLNNDKESEKIAIGCEFSKFYVIKYDEVDSLNLVSIGPSKYETIYKPAMIGVSVVGCIVWGIWFFLGSIISGIIQMSALGFGGALAFILAKNFKKIKDFRIKKNVTILEPVKEKPNSYGVKIVPLVDDPKLKLIER